MSASPYRDPPRRPPIDAPSRDGQVRLTVEGDRIGLQLGTRGRLEISGSAATWIHRRRGRRRPHRRELPLGRAGLWVARAHPTRELGLWVEIAPGIVERLGGVRPVPLLEAEALRAWQALDRLADELRRALAPWNGGVTDATEVGPGQHRVLLLGSPERLVLYARPVFRERPRRTLEVATDGAVVITTRRGERRATVHARLGVTVQGDRVCFADRTERDVASLWLPWITVEDREEVSRRIADLVFPQAPDPPGETRHEPLRPWASGLGRPSPLDALLGAPLPHSVVGRFRR